ncbi:MAG: hypothetical protein ACKOCT_01810 [Alphaproteobacteria bacterium]
MDMMLLFPASSPPEKKVTAPEMEEMVERVLASPSVDVSQIPMHHRSRIDSGEARLALAILDDAIRCVLRHAQSRLAHQRAEAQEALEWIRSDRSDYALCFVPICQLFDIDPDWVREKIDKALVDPSQLRGTWNPGRPVEKSRDEVSFDEDLEREVA